MSKYHSGEIEVQRRAGVEDLARRTATVIKPDIPRLAKDFVLEQPMAVVASVGENSKSWASLLTGEPGFMQAEDERTLRVEAQPARGDPLAENLRDGAAVGLLTIDLTTRRRMKAKGTIQLLPGGGFRLKTERVYALCPKYIQTRDWEFLEGGEKSENYSADSAPDAVLHTDVLSEDQRRKISEADTFFIASFHTQTGADASHRGGFPGFVKVMDDAAGAILWPDYSGNRMFNTLGNITANPNAGLLFVDFERGDTLQLTGEAAVIWDEEVVDSLSGAERAVGFRVGEVLEVSRATTLRWSFGDYSPFNPV
ncbi:MAG: pyridoxamine 5'-phosphate oxidase family protein [Rubrobacteraceae bacterium]